MEASLAIECLRNIAGLVIPDGYLFVSGVDLDIRTSVAKDLEWTPMQELLEEIHYGDPRMAPGWPWNYSSLGPMDKKRRDWRLRYATAFQLATSSKTTQNLEHDTRVTHHSPTKPAAALIFPEPARIRTKPATDSCFGSQRL
jgi:hypothetical protein